MPALRWYERGGDLDELREIAPEEIVVLDTETTGLDASRDEVLQVSLVDGAGNTLIDAYTRPERTAEWPDAQKVNGIAPADVAGCPTLAEIADEVRGHLEPAALVVGYNLPFDLGFLKVGGIEPRSDALRFDVMHEYAPVNGEWSYSHNAWKWARLAVCAAHYGHTFHAHNSLEDAKVTLKCFWSMLDDEDGYLAMAKGA